MDVKWRRSEQGEEVEPRSQQQQLKFKIHRGANSVPPKNESTFRPSAPSVTLSQFSMDGGAAAAAGGDGWSDAVEDLVDNGDVDGAIAVLESVISRLETQAPPPPPGDLRLATVLNNLADLHYGRGFSLKADGLRSRALLLRARALHGDSKPVESDAAEQDEDEDDWEAIADRGVVDEVLLSPQSESGAALSPSCDPKVAGHPKRRGRGSFLYEKSCLYSDQPNMSTASDGVSRSDDEVDTCRHRGDETELDGVGCSRYGTGHVLVLYDFPPSTRTIELEKLFESFTDRGVVIRWVNDISALAVFRTPSIANEAQRRVSCPFKVRTLAEDDDLLQELSTKDLEPPYPRPKTSARTAQRLIAQVMGIKPSTDFGFNELRKQEEARKNRILARQVMKDDAWGSDKP